MEGNQLFPVFIKLNTIRTVLIGAGPVGLEKLAAILSNSPEARIRVIAKEILPEFRELAAAHEGVIILEREFITGDLDHADLVVAATNNNALNQQIRLEADQRNLLVNFADKPDLCNFYLGSIVKKGDLKIAISTNGKSPTIAKRLKEVLNENLPEALIDTLGNMEALRNTLSGDFAEKVTRLNEVTSILVAEKGAAKNGVSKESKVLNDQAISNEAGNFIESQSAVIDVISNEHTGTGNGIVSNETLVAENNAVPEKNIDKVKKNFKWLIWTSIVLSFAIVITAFWHKEPEFQAYLTHLDPMFYWFLIGGFVFAMIDGAIGMSYGVTSTSFSLAMGVPPASASMGVHLSEILSNGIAGWMHYRFGNVNWKLFRMLLIPGIVGAVVGAYLLSSLEHYNHYTKPIISVYTLILGGVILSKAYKINRRVKNPKGKIKKIGLLGLFGGFIDAVGGGGWGSIVLSSLIAGGRNARFSLGTVKITRFFIALMSSLTFITMLNGAHWEAVGGLVIGSALASPIAARVSNKISVKTIMVSVGVLVVLVSLRSIINFILKEF
ncbi:siroheme synthase [Pedobacter sp. PACM 27299]|uniref:TSUP family transporter n=1 Tax=Pedobacter sp. PACM 27299 TaxID=1727164 RepID=UPI000705E86C|nr:TSUP family transporter [Pedobacter sp. PACM 27299]ALL05045.1 siroheme synthase [Pedobacter sp. PACM 27299]